MRNLSRTVVMNRVATMQLGFFPFFCVVCQNAKTKACTAHLKKFGFVDEPPVIAPGINGKMSEVSGAYGLLQLKGIDKAFEQRKLLAQQYRATRARVEGTEYLADAGQPSGNYSCFPILVERLCVISRSEPCTTLRRNGTYARRFFYTLISDFPGYWSFPSAVTANLPGAIRAAKQVICLLNYSGLPSDQVNHNLETSVQ